MQKRLALDFVAAIGPLLPCLHVGPVLRNKAFPARGCFSLSELWQETLK